MRLITVVSASQGAGRTSVVANTGLAAAADGARTLVVDADFGKQDLAHLLVGAIPSVGMTDVLDERVTLDEAVSRVPASEDRSLAVLSRGGKQVDASAYLRSEQARDFFSTLHKGFDLVLIDGPPLLQVGYASTLARYTDAAIVVVDHESDVRDLHEVRDHLALIGTPILGYIYTKAPVLHPLLVSEEVEPAEETGAPGAAIDETVEPPTGENGGADPNAVETTSAPSSTGGGSSPGP